jgi:hypothetical protein
MGYTRCLSKRSLQVHHTQHQRAKSICAEHYKVRLRYHQVARNVNASRMHRLRVRPLSSIYLDSISCCRRLHARLFCGLSFFTFIAEAFELQWSAPFSSVAPKRGYEALIILSANFLAFVVCHRCRRILKAKCAWSVPHNGREFALCKRNTVDFGPAMGGLFGRVSAHEAELLRTRIVRGRTYTRIQAAS